MKIYVRSTHSVTLSLLLLCGNLASAAGLPQAGAVTNISVFGWEPSWSPDSRRIAFSYTNSPGIWVYDRTTGQTRHIHHSGNFPAWSPKGERIAFRRNTHLWLIR